MKEFLARISKGVYRIHFPGNLLKWWRQPSGLDEVAAMRSLALRPIIRAWNGSTGAVTR